MHHLINIDYIHSLDKKRIALCHQLLLIILIVSFLITLVSELVLGGAPWLVEVAVIAPLLLFLIWINARGHYRMAGLVMGVCLPLIVLLADAFFKLKVAQLGSVSEYIIPYLLLLSLLSVPFLIFDIERDRFFLLSSLSVNLLSVFLLGYFHQYLGMEGLLDAAEATGYIYFKYVFLLNWLLFVFSFWVLKQMNHHYETELESANYELQSKQEEIQCQNEELTQQSEQIKHINQELADKEQSVRNQNLTLEQEVSKQTTALKAINQELDLFLYRSSHDLRRPLTTLMGLAEVARANPDPELAFELLEKVNFTAHQMDKMLTKLRMVSDINGDTITFDNIKLRKIIQYQHKLFQKKIDKLGINISIDYDPKLQIWCNDTLLNAIFYNLIENAIQFSRQREPFIQVIIRLEEDILHVRFLDNGQGIEEQYLPHIFEMYFRANEYAKGNGLGLYVVRKSLEKLNGTIEVSSVYGEKTQFDIRIPYIPPKLKK